MGEKLYYSKNERNSAWRAYKYFILNKSLLIEEKNKKLFNAARKIIIKTYRSEHIDADEDSVDRAILMVAKWENKVHPDDFKIDEETEALLLKSE